MPYTFKDSAGKEWTLQVSVATARAVLAETGVNIYGLPQQRFEKLGELLGDPLKMVAVAWVMCRGAATDKNAFEAAIDGPALEGLGEAVLEAIPDFFSDRPGRENLREMLRKGKRVAQRLQERETEKLKAVDPEKADLDAVATAVLAQESFMATSGNGPDSAAEIQAPINSGNSN